MAGLDGPVTRRLLPVPGDVIGKDPGYVILGDVRNTFYEDRQAALQADIGH